MAHVPQVKAEGQTWAGLAATGTVPERIRNSRDSLGQLAFLTRGHTSFLNTIYTRLGKSTVKDKREFKVQEIEELDRQYTVTVASQAGNNHTTFGITNNEAAQLQLNDILYLMNTYAQPTFNNSLYAGQVTNQNQVPTVPTTPPMLDYALSVQVNGVNFSRTFGNVSGVVFTDYEQVYVTNIGAEDSAGAGNTFITVERCFMGPHARDNGGGIIDRGVVNNAIANANGTDASILVGDTVLRGLNSFREGTGLPNGLYRNPTIDVNFTQEFKYAIEHTTESEIEWNTMPKTPREINRWLTTRRMTTDIERAFLFNRKGKSMDREGKVLYTTGGVIEFIPKDTDHVLRYTQPQINYPGILDLTDQIARNGGGKTKDVFLGIRLYNEFKKAFYDSGYMRYNKEESKRFDMNVESLIGSGIVLNLFPNYYLDEAGYGNKMLVLDLSYPSFRPVTHKGWDMVWRKGVQEPGTEIKKDGVVGMKGLERRYADYQHIVEFNI